MKDFENYSRVFKYWYINGNSFVDKKNCKSFILCLGRELRSDQPVAADEILSCDRTIRNENQQDG